MSFQVGGTCKRRVWVYVEFQWPPEEQQEIFQVWPEKLIAQSDTVKNSGFQNELKGGKGNPGDPVRGCCSPGKRDDSSSSPCMGKTVIDRLKST